MHLEINYSRRDLRLPREQRVGESQLRRIEAGCRKHASQGARDRDDIENASCLNRRPTQNLSGLPLSFSDFCQSNRQCGPAQGLHECRVLGIEAADGLDHRRIRVLRMSRELLNRFG